MNIGIVTIYDAYNYGSFLQAFAMQEFLKLKGHEVVILDCSLSVKSIVSRKYLAKSLKRSMLKLRRFCAYRKDWKLLSIQHIRSISNLDVVIIGSDEVWNIDNESFEHVKQFYGIDCRARRIITYGPSLGYATKDSYKLYPELIEAIKQNIGQFYVRDAFTEEFLKSFVNKKIKRVCDPTLLLYDRWMEYAKTFSLEYKYLVYYSYKDNTPFKDYIKRFAKEHNLKIVTVGFAYKWCDEQLIVTPREFLSLINQAQFVVTSTFHGTVFSSLLKKRFVVIHPAVKVMDYLHLLDIKKLCTLENGYAAFSNMLMEDIDYEAIEKKIHQLCTDSGKCIDEGLLN